MVKVLPRLHEPELERLALMSAMAETLSGISPR
jgi:hypothetical protein